MAETIGAASATWVPLLSVTLGFASSQLLEWLKDRRSYRRESEARALSRHDALRERRNEFQRQTLLDLQDALLDYLTVVLEMQRLQRERYRNTGTWEQSDVPDDLIARMMLANVRITKLATRVSDQAVRDAINRAQEVGRPGRSVMGENNLAGVEQPLGAILEEINNRIGELLRQLDVEEVV